MNEVARKGANKHTVPVIDRMMEILAVLESRPDGATVTDLTEALKRPRTTVYRILNTIRHHVMVRRDDGGTYRLGSRRNWARAASCPWSMGKVCSCWRLRRAVATMH